MRLSKTHRHLDLFPLLRRISVIGEMVMRENESNIF